MRVLTCTQIPPNHHRNTVRLPFVHFVHLPLHGSLLARLALLAHFVSFRPPHYCSSSFSSHHHETIEENGRNTNSNPRPGTKEHPVARGNDQTAKRSAGRRGSSNDRAERSTSELLGHHRERCGTVVTEAPNSSARTRERPQVSGLGWRSDTPTPLVTPSRPDPTDQRNHRHGRSTFCTTCHGCRGIRTFQRSSTELGSVCQGTRGPVHAV